MRKALPPCAPPAQAAERETALTRAFEAKRDGIGSLLACWRLWRQNPGPLLLLHPDGALGTARSGMMMADVTPALQAEALALRPNWQELADLRSLQLSAGETLEAGLAAAQRRAPLSQAISDRTDLPRRFTDDPEVLRAFWKAPTRWMPLPPACPRHRGAPPDFADQKGTSALPVLGKRPAPPGEADAAGVRRPGMTLATQGRALVTAPWPPPSAISARCSTTEM
jgi:murein hydrolase activator